MTNHSAEAFSDAVATIQILAGFVDFAALSDGDRAFVEYLTDPHRYDDPADDPPFAPDPNPFPRLSWLPWRKRR